MDIIGKILTVLVVVVIYIIIFIALRIMYKDIKNGGRKKLGKKVFGLEVIQPGKGTNLKKGSVIPVSGRLTIGRKEDNLLRIVDSFVSGHHTKIYEKNNQFYIEDLKSTNGTLLNSEHIDRAVLNSGDNIKIGDTEFRVI